MIDIYFVRHGQTDGNLAKRHQVEHTKLTPEGKEQIEKTARWAKELQPTHLLSSRHVRTLQSAEIIGEHTNLLPVGEEVFIELRRPDAIYGHHHRSPRSMWYLLSWYFGFAGGDGHNGEGESYEVFRKRLHAAQEYLAELPDTSRVVVVSHAVFIGFMIEHLCQREPVSLLQAWRLFSKLLHIHNASYTHVRYDPDAVPGTCPWQLIAYNQHEHIDT